MEPKKNNVADIYPLSPLQEGMVFHTLLAPETGVYFEQLSCRLEGDLDRWAFERAWQKVVERHDVLRTAFFWEKRDKPFQVVYRRVELPWQRLDWSGLSAAEQEARLEDLLRRDRAAGFDLTDPPLLRCALIDAGGGSHIFVWSFHHLLLDGWSVPLVLREVFAFYAGFQAGREPMVEPPRSYRNYIGWLRRRDAAADEAYWRRILAGLTAPTPIAASRPWQAAAAEEEEAGEGEVGRMETLAPGLTERLAVLARRHGVTLNSVLQAAWALLLGRTSGEPDVVFGTTVSGRPPELAGAESTVGLFINTVPVRVRLASPETVVVFLRRLHAAQAEMGPHAHTPLIEIQGWSGVPRNLPLFESLLVFENYPVDDSLHGRTGEVEIRDVRFRERTHYPLTVVAEPGAGLRLRFAADARRFDAAGLARMAEHLVHLLAGLAGALDDPSLQVADLPLAGGAQRHQLLAEWNDTEQGPVPERCIHELFAEQALRTPDAVAVVTDGRFWTYAEVSREARRLARHLRSLGVGPGVLVGVWLERCAEMVPALLGILEAGGAYVPLETSWPLARVEWIVGSLGLRHLVSGGSLRARIGELRPTAALEHVIVMGEGAPTDLVPPGEAPAPLAGPDDLAYIIFTSGSTGTPKGVMVRHRPVINLIEWVNGRFGIGPADRVLCVASLCFDLSVYDIFGLLAAGGSVRIASAAELAEAESLVRILRNEPVTFWDSAPAALQQLAPLFPPPPAAGNEPALRLAFLSGDWVPLGLPDELRASFPRAEVIALGGATEATVWSNVFPVRRAEPSWVSIPYGRPIANAAYHVLDRDLHPCPIGVAGDLYIGGDCLSSGYINEPELTASKYIPDPFRGVPGASLYRTGDRARYWPDGNLEFLGRLDHQVKIRGFRIELGEIEAQLVQHPALASAVAVVREDEPGRRRLVAYVLPADGVPAPSAAELRAFLEDRLPASMVPSAFVALAELPVTPNGKLDRKALPRPESAGEKAGPVLAPRGPVEEMIAGVWAEVLGRERVGRDDDFFELGGHSLLATQLVSRLRKLFQIDLPLRSLFEAPTVTGLARLVAASRPEAVAAPAPPLRPAPRQGELPLSFAQRRLWLADRLEGGGSYNIGIALRFRGPLAAGVLEAALREVVRRHEVLRTTFPEVDGAPVPVVSAENRLGFTVIDLSGVEAAGRDAAVRQLTGEEVARPFDLAAGPLVRCTVLRTGAEEHAVVFVLHHIAGDGWSMGVLVREVAALYAAFAAGRPSPLPELPVQYADFAAWQREQLRDEGLETQIAWWRRHLGGSPAELRLPEARPQTGRPPARGAEHRFELPAELAAELAALGRREGATLFMVLLAALQGLLSRLTGAEDLVIGTDIANRNLAETEPLIGLFVNQLALRADLSGNPTFRALLQRVRERTLEAYAHQDLPFDRLVEALRPERERSRSPLFQVTYTHQNTPLGALQLPELAVEPFAAPPRPSHFDLSLFTEESGGRLTGLWSYHPGVFPAETVARLSRQMEIVLRTIARDPETRLTVLEIDIPASKERQQMQKSTGPMSFKNFKPTPVNLSKTELVRMKPLRGDGGLPLVIEPAIDELDIFAWMTENRKRVEEEILRHGALLFRGFHLGTPELFERFARTICPELFNENGEHPRESVSGDIYTPVFYPPEKQLLWHNENSFNHRWPLRIMFCAARPADRGGETPVVDSRRVFDRIDPKVRQLFLEKQVMYVRNYGTGLGLDWQTVFRSSDRAAVEARCRAEGMTCEWRGDVLRTRCVRPAVVLHPKTGEPSWFNQAQHWHPACLDPETRQGLQTIYGEEDMPRDCRFGDGSRIPDSVMQDILAIYQELEVCHPWETGNVMVLDNVLAAHGRNPYQGPRKLLVALGEMMDFDLVPAAPAADLMEAAASHA